MSHNQLRAEKNCLNCGHTVDERFCSFCGQENIQPRQTFVHLVAHVFEDITHYEGKFWGSLKLLFFKPGQLSKCFLEGKRNAYFAPVRLYIFASFITFFLPSLIPSAPDEEGSVSPVAVATIDSTDRYEKADSALRQTFGDSTANKLKRAIAERQQDPTDTSTTHTSINFGYGSKDGIRLPTEYSTLKEVDSARLARKDSEDPMNWVEYMYEKKAVEFKKNKYSPEEQLALFFEALQHNFPKALFLYMPLFAFVLRLFHKRKNWIYFDHGIFTLHYFSFVLLTFLLMVVLADTAGWVAFAAPNTKGTMEVLLIVLFTLGYLSFPYYLYKAHSKMYGETAGISFLKTSGILMLNSVLFVGVFLTLVVYTLFTMH